jgi:uncharacterized protein YndB with AHSA1/START domain
MTDQAYVYDIIIGAAPQKVWGALTDGTITPTYYFGSRIESPSWKKGDSYRYANADGTTLLDGSIIDIDAPTRLVTSFRPVWLAGMGVAENESHHVSQVTFELTPMGANTTQLTVTHTGLIDAAESNGRVLSGWTMILSGMKTVIETGSPLAIG